MAIRKVAKCRMLHNKISKSMQVDNLPVEARLLFTWMISHADEEGRLKGEPRYVKATVVPLTKWSDKKIKNYLELMQGNKLIYYWETNNEWFVEFIKWTDYQSFRKDRFQKSDLPSFTYKNDNQSSTNSQPSDNQKTAQANRNELNEIKVNKSEPNKENLADGDSYKENEDVPDPESYEINNNGEAEALRVWKVLEPNNPRAFYTTYLTAYKSGLPDAYFGTFLSEIEQDPSIKSPGAVFNKKVEDYFIKCKNSKSKNRSNDNNS